MMRSTLTLGLAAAACLAAPQMTMDMKTSRYGGPVYNGAPALAVTASLVEAGGGPEDFSTAKALTAIAGPALVKAEVAKLTKQYGKTRVGRFLAVFDFAVKEALKEATAAGVKLPAPTLSGAKLGAAIVTAGQDAKGTFYTEYMLDHAVSHKIHGDVMMAIDKKFGAAADKDYHRISNQAHYDLGKALGIKNLKIAALH